MPKSGHKSITIHERVYDYYEALYKMQKDNLELQGVNSFAAFMVKLLKFGYTSYLDFLEEEKSKVGIEEKTGVQDEGELS